MTAMQTFTVTYIAPTDRGVSHKWNVDFNGRAYGQIWAFGRSLDSSMKHHAKLLTGEYKLCRNYADAEAFIRGSV